MAINLGGLNLRNLKLDNLYSTYLGMNPREQTIALVASVAALLLVIILPVTIASGRIGKLESDVEKGRGQLKEVMNAIESYGDKSTKLAGLQRLVGGGFDSSLSTTLETLADTSGIKDRIDSLKERTAQPSDIFDESSVDVRLKKVGLEQVVDYLHAIENNPNTLLRLKKLSIKTRYDNKQELDVSFTVSTYRLLEGGGEAPAAEEGT